MNCSDNTAADVDTEVMKLLKESYKDAKKLLKENRKLLDQLAEFLIERETITGKEFMKIFRKEKGLPEPEETPEQKRQELMPGRQGTQSFPVPGNYGRPPMPMPPSGGYRPRLPQPGMPYPNGRPAAPPHGNPYPNGQPGQMPYGNPCQNGHPSQMPHGNPYRNDQLGHPLQGFPDPNSNQGMPREFPDQNQAGSRLFPGIEEQPDSAKDGLIVLEAAEEVLKKEENAEAAQEKPEQKNADLAAAEQTESAE